MGPAASDGSRFDAISCQCLICILAIAPDHPDLEVGLLKCHAYFAGLPWSRHRATRSETFASPILFFNDTATTEIYTVPSDSATAPQVKTTLWTYPVISQGSSGCKIHESPTPMTFAGFSRSCRAIPKR